MLDVIGECHGLVGIGHRELQVTPEALNVVRIGTRRCLDFVHGLRPTVEINP
jgi:hypothetical protein